MHDTHLEVRVFSHHFSVHRLTPRAKHVVMAFARQYVQSDWEKRGNSYVKVPVKAYAASTVSRRSFRFHINLLSEFKTFLENNTLKGDLVSWHVEPLPDVETVKFEVYEHWQDKPEQKPMIDYLANSPHAARFLGLQTGKGKSYCAMKAMSIIGMKIAVVVKPMYMGKWLEDFLKTYNITIEETCFIQGSESLMEVIRLAKLGKANWKIYIFSNATMRDYFKEYEEYEDELLEQGYGCLPHELFPLLGIGVRLIDEVHQDFHFNFRLDLYTHVAYSISLSATLLSKDVFMLKMYEVAYPQNQRCPEVPLDKYIDAFSFYYQLSEPDKIKTSNFGRTSYSHDAFEKSIMRNPKFLKKYLALVEYSIDIGYLVSDRKKKKCLVFAYSVEMCTLLRDHFKEKWPDLDINRFVSKDPKKWLYESDICFSTLGSAGTLHDIPDLITVILTQAVDSIQSTVQSMGRLRKVMDSWTRFYYFVCQDIDAHNRYDRAKQGLMKARAKSLTPIYTGMKV